MSAEEPYVPPVATVEAPRRRSWTWLLPVLALALAAWLLVRARDEAGLLVTVRAADGHGIAAGDAVRFRGIDVGHVEGARLSTGLEEVVLDVRLAPFAAGLARTGTRFWIARPTVRLEDVAGLETLFGARYLSVVEGAPGGAPARAFVALDEPPLDERFEPGGLELVLEAPTRFGLAPGAPVQHRGVDVGSVVAVALAPDAARVEVRAYVRPEYARLVRANTRFWEVGGAELTVGLTTGLRLDVEGLRALLVGAVAFATPDDPGAPVEDGWRFELADARPDDADAWRPALGVGRDLDAPDGPPRVPVHALRLGWTEGRIFKRDEERRGWGVVLDGHLIGPAALLVPPEDAREGSLAWSLDGEPRALLGAPARRRGDLVAVPLPEGLTPTAVSAPRRLPGAPEPCLVVAGPGTAPIAFDEGRLEPAGERWRVDPELVVPADWNGAPVVARRDGALLGLLVVDGDDVEVAPLP